MFIVLDMDSKKGYKVYNTDNPDKGCTWCSRKFMSVISKNEKVVGYVPEFRKAVYNRETNTCYSFDNCIAFWGEVENSIVSSLVPEISKCVSSEDFINYILDVTLYYSDQITANDPFSYKEYIFDWFRKLYTHKTGVAIDSFDDMDHCNGYIKYPMNFNDFIDNILILEQPGYIYFVIKNVVIRFRNSDIKLPDKKMIDRQLYKMRLYGSEDTKCYADSHGQVHLKWGSTFDLVSTEVVFVLDKGSHLNKLTIGRGVIVKYVREIGSYVVDCFKTLNPKYNDFARYMYRGFRQMDVLPVSLCYDGNVNPKRQINMSWFVDWSLRASDSAVLIINSIPNKLYDTYVQEFLARSGHPSVKIEYDGVETQDENYSEARFILYFDR